MTSTDTPSPTSPTESNLPEGRCYRLAAEIFLRATIELKEKHAVLVHGFITYPSGRRINHAWVEIPDKNRLIEMGTSRETLKEDAHAYKLDWFYQNAKIETIARYHDPFLVAEVVNKTQSWGPYRWLDYLWEQRDLAAEFFAKGR